jgi:rubrerythrin
MRALDQVLEWLRMPDIQEVLAAAIEFERFGQEYYMRFHALVSDEKARLLMKSLANDEKEHEGILSSELAKLGGRAVPPSKELLEKGLAEIFPADTKAEAIGRAGTISAIEVGIGIEQRSVDFYAQNAATAGPRLQKVFEMLGQMEQGHIELLRENLHYLKDDGVWYGYLPILD